MAKCCDRQPHKAAETLKYQTQDKLEDNITSLMGQDPSQSYSHKELAKITGSLSHTLIATLKPAGADMRTTSHHAARIASSGMTGRD